MTRILVDAEHLQALAALLRKHATDLRATSDQLNATVNGLSPKTDKQLNIDAQWEQARTLARALAQQAEDQASTLGLKARRLQEADQDGASQLASAFADFQAVMSQAPAGWQPGAYAPPVPQDLVGRVSALGGSSGAAIQAASVAGLVALAGVAAVTTRQLRGSKLQEVQEPVQSVSPTSPALPLGIPNLEQFAVKGAEGVA
jgi:hypothetical protein